MGSSTLIKSLNFLEEIIKDAIQHAKNLDRIIKDYSTISVKLKKEMQYHLNIIDELHINENSNSRILFKLLSYRNSEEEYEFLNSFLNYIGQKNENFNSIELNEVKIYQEKFRIDLLITTNNNAIIIENKIYNADDKELQISRYIDKIKEIFNDESEIYVIYLSQTGQEPTSQTWGPYKGQFKERYVNLSFCDDIRNWLKHITPDSNQRFLKSALHQYSDYLDGLFNKREINKEIYMELQNIIKEKLNITENTSNEDTINCLQTEIANVDDIRQQMYGLLKTYYEKEFTIFKEDTSKDYKDLQPNGKRSYVVSICDVSLKYQSLDLVVSITDNGSKLYCQVEIYQKGENSKEVKIPDTLVKELKNGKILDNTNDWAIWRYFEYDKYKDAYTCFKEAIKCIQNLDNHDNK